MSSNLLFRSFAGGEITPEMYGRLDLAKYQTGLAKALNFTILPHGPAARRPGFKFIAEVRDSTQACKLIPFQFSSTQTAVLEFCDETVRMQIGAASLLEPAAAIASIVGSLVTTTGAHGYSSGQDVFIGTRFHRITVTGATTFTTANRWGAATTATGATASRVYTVATPYQAADVFELHYAQDSDVLTIVHPEYAAADLARVGATNWTLTTLSFAPSTAVPTGVGVVATIGTAGNQNPQSYVVTALDTDGVTESLASATVSTSNNLTISGNYNTITCNSTAGRRYNFYKQRGGAFGYIGQAIAAGATVSIVDDNVLADTSKTPPEDIYTLNTGSGEYPSAVTYHEQRRWFAGTMNEPQTVYATRNATQSNLTSSIPSQDDDGLKFRIASRQQNAILHLVPLSDLAVLTVGGEFRVYADNAPAITPTSLTPKPQGYSGASNVQPAVTSGSILYVQGRGSRIREMAYKWESSAYVSIDISIMAPHLFNGYSVVDMAYANAPVPTLWCVRSDGALLGMTYVPEQQVYAWHQHTTTGFFESCCVVGEDSEDALYVVVRRTINGRSVRYIERLQSRIFTDQEDAFFVDSGLTYDGAPTSSLTGLYHLEGQTVQILADGAVHPTRVVTAGSVTLDGSYSVVHVGLAYTSDMMTLPASFESAPAGGQGRTKNINGVAMRVTQSSVVKAGPTFTDLVENAARDVTDPYDSPPQLRTGELRFDISPDWNADGSICIRQDLPLPLTVLSMAVDSAVGG
jgi:hypothetical protein